MKVSGARRTRWGAIGRVVRSRGFTLLELMIVVAIIAILAAVAYPTYIKYITRTKRNAAEGCLTQYANYMERYYTTNLRYDEDPTTGTALNIADVTLDCATQSQTGENYVYSGALTQSTYKILATPKPGSAQASRDTECGVLGIDQSGQRYYQSTLDDLAGLENCWKK